MYVCMYVCMFHLASKVLNQRAPCNTTRLSSIFGNEYTFFIVLELSFLRSIQNLCEPFLLRGEENGL